MAVMSHHLKARWCRVGVVVCLLLGSTIACGRSEGSGVPTLRWYAHVERSGASEKLAQRCTEAAEGRYRIMVANLPSSADQQREQLVRRLAARDRDIDIIGMDVIWTPEFAEAGWILPWKGQDAAEVAQGTIGATLESGRYEGRLWAAPFTTDTQLLWYRKDRVPQPPRTWAEMIEMAERLGDQGKIQVQGGRYEGLTVWFNSLLASAGGQVVDDTGKVALQKEPTVRALEVMRKMATSSAADPGLSTAKEDEARTGFESGDSSFMVNYGYVWRSARENAPDVATNMAWAPWPRVVPNEPSHVTLGGLNLSVGAYSRYPDLAFEAIRCIRSPENQVFVAQFGHPPVNAALYDDPRVIQRLPFAQTLRQQLLNATPRPQHPAYNDISLVIQRTLHPPRSIAPDQAWKELRASLAETLSQEHWRL